MLTTVEFEKPYDGALSLALGFFDGVHLGHRTLFEKIHEFCKSSGTIPAVSTFSDMATRKQIIYSYRDRKRMFEELGLQVCIALNFNKIKHLSGNEFFYVLVHTYNIKHIVCGEDYTFGCDHCDVETLRELCNEYGITFVVMPMLVYKGVCVSSTNIRALLRAGDVDLAKKLLKVPYHVSGEVVSGDGRGRNIGIPTANIDLPRGGMEIKHGVYGTYTELDGKLYRSVTNYGPRPTFLQSKFAIETNILGENFDSLRGKIITVYFHRFIRGVSKYLSEKLLIATIKKDQQWEDL
ncbi:MAG: riboflavin biosynthesis protein RibF [Clostridia bacterium]|nr:riboflavin biosynthesis protein RibF [Clostridia bacterium]